MSFWLEYGSNEARQLVAFADELAATPAGRPGICFGPLNAPATTLEPLYRQARASGEAIVDPHGYLLDRPPTERSRNHFPWLVQTPRPTTRPEWEQWMERGLGHQLSARLCGNAGPPSFVITPSPTMDTATPDDLNTVLDAATAVRSRVSGHDCWLGVTVDRTYLREPRHLTRLLNAVIQTGADGVVFRSPHLQLAPVDDRFYLDGLREVVETCAANGIRIFLPSSGWLGWLAMGWGAWGFSGGMAAGSWFDRIPGPMTSPQQPSLPYFEPQLLRLVQWRIHEQLVNEPEYQPCGCPDCVQMGSSHDLSLAKRHQIRHASQETATLNAVPVDQRRQLVAARLDAAINFRDSLSPIVSARIPATIHLDRWRALL
ncbi:hypothetical protein MSIMFB_02098 [Mycobacterium simulans]|uniref:Uncharacterized protein n=1 Tax=Mycobacterium simulans TaxID=627089 RepID=A0A7Z7ILE0_9MYCO|nr:hypothetical protein [Mycobacterium simulans]SOJ54609.1 hypothetical protein MSIMFB_02098 [Mycobacterium simulans]